MTEMEVNTEQLVFNMEEAADTYKKKHLLPARSNSTSSGLG